MERPAVRNGLRQHQCLGRLGLERPADVLALDLIDVREVVLGRFGPLRKTHADHVSRLSAPLQNLR